jgi:hypothetical protein
MLIAVINESTMVTNAQVQTMCQAIQIQLNLHVLPAWNMKAATITFYADKTKVPGYAWVVSMLDTTTQAGALGYHEEDNDVVDAFIFAQPVLTNGGAVMVYNPANPGQYLVSSTLSHEVCEMIGDRFANAFVVGANGTTMYCQELCDPVEDGTYAITVAGQSIGVSNFIFPSWYNPEATVKANAPFDYMSKLKAPFTMTAGGYIIEATMSNETQVTTQKKFGEKMPQWRKDYVNGVFYRR